MGFREIKATPTPPDDITQLFEEAEQAATIVRRPAPTEPVTRPPEWKTTYSPDSIPIENFPLVKKRFQFPRLSFPKLYKPSFNLKKVGIMVVKDVLGVGLVWFGITNTGSYFGPKSGVFGGFMAELFYRNQFGMILAVIGVLLVYDTLRHR